MAIWQLEVEALLAEQPQVSSFLEKPALREIAHEFAASASWVSRQIGSYQFVSLLGAGEMFGDPQLGRFSPSAVSQPPLICLRHLIESNLPTSAEAAIHSSSHHGTHVGAAPGPGIRRASRRVPSGTAARPAWL